MTLKELEQQIVSEAVAKFRGDFNHRFYGANDPKVLDMRLFAEQFLTDQLNQAMRKVAEESDLEPLYLSWDVEDTNGVLLLCRMGKDGVTTILGEIDFSKHPEGIYRLNQDSEGQTHA